MDRPYLQNPKLMEEFHPTLFRDTKSHVAHSSVHNCRGFP